MKSYDVLTNLELEIRLSVWSQALNLHQSWSHHAAMPKMGSCYECRVMREHINAICAETNSRKELINDKAVFISDS